LYVESCGDVPSPSPSKEDDAMTKIMTPSENTITAGQIGKIQDNLAAALRKSGLPSEPTQEVIETQGDSLIAELVAAVRKRVEAVNKIIRRAVKVDRTKTAAEVIDATSRVRWYTDEQVLAEMPLDGREEDIVKFFELDYDPTVDELDREYKTRILRPDPAAVAQAMTDDPALADERPVSVQWRNSKGHACYAIFDRYGGKRDVRVDRGDDGWDRDYRFAGVRK